MKLSEAIRIGSKQRPQAFYLLFASKWVDTSRGPRLESYASCAWGAALEGAGLINPAIDDDHDYDEFIEEFDGLVDAHLDEDGVITKIQCAVADCEHNRYDIPYLVEHLNDDHKWSREKIAEWLEGMGL